MPTPNPAKKHRDKGEIKPPLEVDYNWHSSPGSTIRSKDGIVCVRTLKEPEGDVRLLVDAGTFKREEGARNVGSLMAQLLVGPDGMARTFGGRDIDVLGLMLAEWHRIDKNRLEQVLRQMLGPAIQAPIILTDKIEEVEDNPNG